MYKLAYHHKAVKLLEKLSIKEKQLISQQLELLQQNPFAKTLDIKKLAATIRTHRLRVKNIRIIFEPDTKRKIIFIHNTDFRGSVYN